MTRSGLRSRSKRRRLCVENGEGGAGSQGANDAGKGCDKSDCESVHAKEYDGIEKDCDEKDRERVEVDMSGGRETLVDVKNDCHRNEKSDRDRNANEAPPQSRSCDGSSVATPGTQWPLEANDAEMGDEHVSGREFGVSLGGTGWENKAGVDRG